MDCVLDTKQAERERLRAQCRGANRNGYQLEASFCVCAPTHCKRDCECGASRSKRVDVRMFFCHEDRYVYPLIVPDASSGPGDVLSKTLAKLLLHHAGDLRTVCRLSQTNRWWYHVIRKNDVAFKRLYERTVIWKKTHKWDALLGFPAGLFRRSKEESLWNDRYWFCRVRAATELYILIRDAYVCNKVHLGYQQDFPLLLLRGLRFDFYEQRTMQQYHAREGRRLDMLEDFYPAIRESEAHWKSFLELATAMFSHAEGWGKSCTWRGGIVTDEPFYYVARSFYVHGVSVEGVMTLVTERPEKIQNTCVPKLQTDIFVSSVSMGVAEFARDFSLLVERVLALTKVFQAMDPTWACQHVKKRGMNSYEICPFTPATPLAWRDVLRQWLERTRKGTTK